MDDAAASADLDPLLDALSHVAKHAPSRVMRAIVDWHNSILQCALATRRLCMPRVRTETAGAPLSRHGCVCRRAGRLPGAARSPNFSDARC